MKYRIIGIVGSIANQSLEPSATLRDLHQLRTIGTLRGTEYEVRKRIPGVGGPSQGL